MYYNGAKIFLISFFVSIFTSIIVCAAFFYVLPMISPAADVVIPDMVGSTTEQARVIAEARKLLFIVGGEEESDNVPANLICRQMPLPGSVVKSKSTITIFISKGSSKISLPDLSGQGFSEATVKLSDLGLKIGEVRSEENGKVEKDKIISTIPAAGTMVNKGDLITIVLSRGPELVVVPHLVGKSVGPAKRLIQDNGFTVGNVVYEVSTEYNVDIVIRQSPAAGMQYRKGTRINLVVATVLE